MIIWIFQREPSSEGRMVFRKAEISECFFGHRPVILLAQKVCIEPIEDEV